MEKTKMTKDSQKTLEGYKKAIDARMHEAAEAGKSSVTYISDLRADNDADIQLAREIAAYLDNCDYGVCRCVTTDGNITLQIKMRRRPRE